MGRKFWDKGILKPFSSTQKPLTKMKDSKAQAQVLKLVVYLYKIIGVDVRMCLIR
jgi:hypothetical protein